MRPFWLEQALALENEAPCEALAGETRARCALWGAVIPGYGRRSCSRSKALNWM